MKHHSCETEHGKYERTRPAKASHLQCDHASLEHDVDGLEDPERLLLADVVLLDVPGQLVEVEAQQRHRAGVSDALSLRDGACRQVRVV